MKQHLLNFAIKFLEEHWKELDLDKLDIKESKEEFIELVKTDESLPEWVIFDVAHWGHKNPYRSYLDRWEVEHLDSYDSSVWNFGGRYFRFSRNGDYDLVEVFPKEETIKIFE